MRNGTGLLGGHFLSIRHESRRCARFPVRSLSVSDDFALLGLTPFASKSDVKLAYKRLALKYHPDVIKGDNGREKQDIFKEIKSAYESLIEKFEEEEEQESSRAGEVYEEEYDDCEEWMGFEGGIPVIYNPSQFHLSQLSF